MILLEFDNVLTTGARVDVYGSKLTCSCIKHNNFEKFDLKNTSKKNREFAELRWRDISCHLASVCQEGRVQSVFLRGRVREILNGMS